MTTATEYLDPKAVADLLGVSVATVHSYKHRGLLPDPDATFGQTPAWLAATIEKWKATRPGQGKGGGRKPSEPS